MDAQKTVSDRKPVRDRIPEIIERLTDDGWY